MRKLIFLVATLLAFSLTACNKPVAPEESACIAPSNHKFYDYNDKTVKGRAVKSAVDSFADDNVAIFIHTLAMEDSDAMNQIINTHSTWNNIPSDSNISDTPGGKSYSQLWRMDGLEVDTNDGGSNDTDVLFINYGAQLASDGVFTIDDKISFSEGFAFSPDNNLFYNTDKSSLIKLDSHEYIVNSATFKAELIKSQADEVLGIIFYQKRGDS